MDLASLEQLVTSILKLTPEMAMVALTIIFLFFAKNIPLVQKWHLPFAAAVMCGIIYPMIRKRGDVPMDIPVPVVMYVIQGALMGFGATGVNQLFRLGKERRHEMKASKEEEKTVAKPTTPP